MTRLTATHAASPPRRERGSRTARRFMSASGSERLEASGPHRAADKGGPERSISNLPVTPAVRVPLPGAGAMVQRCAMPAERKVSDDELERLRDLADDGWSHDDLAQAFGVSRQHVGRLVRGEQRPTIAGLDAEALRCGVSGAVDAFLAGIELSASDAVLAATAHSLATKLDGCAASDATAAAQAVPRLASQLVDVLDRLRLGVPREPDALDLLRQRREARLLALATANGYSVRGDGS
jgi:transcriptional regulator with XRE-family HTH domain